MIQKIRTYNDLIAIKKNYQKSTYRGKNKDCTRYQKQSKKQILICTGGGCVASGSLKVSAAIKKEIEKCNLESQVEVIETGCFGPCALGPVAIVNPGEVLYQRLVPEDAPEIIETHIINGNIIDRLLYKDTSNKSVKTQLKEFQFIKKQKKIALQNCGVINPLHIEDYIAHEGYKALYKVITENKPEDVVDIVKKSGLRGRGGAGFLTGLKWTLAMKATGTPKYVLCNADEGDPGAFMDRSILEGDPHSIIEAMTIAGYCIGSSSGFIYVRAEYPLAVERLTIAINQAYSYGLLGNSIMGTAFSFDLEIRKGSGAFVCGEETALMISIEGNRGEPKPRPPYPVESGLLGKPSLLNNVETYANIPKIILNGAEWYASMGTEKSKGTKVFALAGAVNMTGLVEIPIGTPLGDIIFDIGGGIPDNKKFKAAQMGGPSGGCIPASHLNVSVDYESLSELGAIMGSGGLIVMNEDTCMVDVARFFLEFVQEESCGKCAPCRIGTKRMLEIVTRICNGMGKEGDIEKLIDVGTKIKDTALCGLGQTAPNPVLSTIRHFREEYELHIKEKRCPAGVCPELVRTPCQNACPAGVDVPGFISLIREKRYKDALLLHRERNPFAAVCARVCFHPCELKCRRATIDSPVAIRALKRFMVDMVDKEEETALPEIRKNSANENQKIAIIGAGPSGLSCAYFLARLGYKPHIYESTSKPGGMLVQTIPEYRLPRNVLNKEIKMIENMGVCIYTNKALGKDFTLLELPKMGYKAVFLGVGLPQGRTHSIAQENGQYVSDAISFLRDYNIHKLASVGNNVVVIGGGNAAFDAARTAKRLGAEPVTIMYRRTKNEMPAFKEEIYAAEQEGIKLMPLTSPDKILTNNGHISHLQYTQMTLGDFDNSGRKKPIETQKKYKFYTEHIISAIGQRIDMDTIIKNAPIVSENHNSIVINKNNSQTSIKWLFAGGDVVTGPASVVEAVAGGERAAVGIDNFLTGENHAFWRKEKYNDTFFDPDADPFLTKRAEIQMIPVINRSDNFEEIELALKETTALIEAKRCLRCDYRDTIVC